MITSKYLAKVSERSAGEKTFSADNIQGLIINYADIANVVAFRGTEFDPAFEAIKDIFTNLMAMPKNTEDCGKVHSGLYKAAKAASEEVIKRLDPSLRVYLTGHSMGGAIALLIAPILVKKGYTVKVITFGAPKVVYNDSETLEHYKNITITQYIHKRDIVPAKFFNWPWNYTNINIAELGPSGKKSWKDHDIDKYIRLL
jgi:predicted lipase